MAARRCEEGLAALAEAFVLMEKTGDRLTEAELLRLKAALLLIQDPSRATAAELHFRDAIRVSEGQSAKLLELRAAVSLARLLR